MKLQAAARPAFQPRTQPDTAMKAQSCSSPIDTSLPAKPKGEPISGRLLVRMATGAALPSAVILAARAVWGEAAATPAIIATASVGAAMSGLWTARECRKHNERNGFTVGATVFSACMGGLAGLTLAALAMPEQGACAMLPFRPEQFGQLATVAAVAAPVLLASAAFLPPYSDSTQGSK